MLIRGLGHEIRRLEAELRDLGAAGAAFSWPAVPQRPRSIHALSTANASKPLTALKTRRKQALKTMRQLSSAIDRGELDRVTGLAQTAASRLAALPAACSQAKRYLGKAGLGTRFSRSRIIGALRRLKATPLPRSAALFARTLHLTRAQMHRLIRRAKAISTSRIKATAVSDLVCSPKLDAIDKSLAGTLIKLADAL